MQQFYVESFNEGEEMNIDEFFSATQEELSKFSEFWRKGHKESARMFPNEMEHGEWLEQFSIFCERTEE